MNKEYFYLSDKELIVTDTKGHITKRNVESPNMHDVLVLENYLEMLYNKINNLEAIIKNYEQVTLNKKEKVIASIIPFIIGMAAYVFIGIAQPEAFSHVIPTTIGIALCTATIELGLLNYNSRHLNGIKCELSTAYQLKEDLEQRLTAVKDKSRISEMQNTTCQEATKTNINEVVVLEEPKAFYEEASEKLNRAYTTGFSKNVKRLTLKRKNQNPV